MARELNFYIFTLDFVYWWKYWERGHREIYWIWLGIKTDGFMEKRWIRIDIHLFNFGVIIRI